MRFRCAVYLPLTLVEETNRSQLWKAPTGGACRGTGSKEGGKLIRFSACAVRAMSGPCTRPSSGISTQASSTHQGASARCTPIAYGDRTSRLPEASSTLFSQVHVSLCLKRTGCNQGVYTYVYGRWSCTALFK
jgi:hypothetical protein